MQPATRKSRREKEGRNPAAREGAPDDRNPIGLDGIEFVEYATSRPQALVKVLEQMGFHLAARHRSREVTLYRQGGMNVVVNAQEDDARVTAMADGAPVISAVAFRVRDARQARRRCIELGAWEVPSRADAMELNIPAIRGPGGARFYFVDRYRDFDIYDIDFVPVVSPAGTKGRKSAAIASDLHFFGVVQYIGAGRTDDWVAYFRGLFGFAEIPDKQRFGIMPKGLLMKSPCGRFLWQLIEPDPAMEQYDNIEQLQRVGLGTADVLGAVRALKARGVAFVDSDLLHPDDRGALTRSALGSVAFELVHDERP